MSSLRDVCRWMVLAFLLTLLAIPAAAQLEEFLGYDNGQDFVAAVEDFVLNSIEEVGMQTQDFVLIGDQTYTVEVIVDDELQVLSITMTNEAGQTIFPSGEEPVDVARFRRFLDQYSDYRYLPFQNRRQIETGQVITEVPGGPLDDIFSQIVLGRAINLRPFVDVSGGEGGEGETIDRLAAIVRYTRFHLAGAEGNSYGITMGWTRESDTLRYGVIVPYDRIDFDSSAEDADSFTVSPYLQVVLLRDPVVVSVGPYLLYNYAFINDTPNFHMWGAGMSASVEAALDPLWVRLGLAGEYLNTNVDHPVDSVYRVRAGGVLGFPIVSDSLQGRLFVLGTLADEGLLGGDDEYGSAGGELNAAVSDAFALTLGYLSSFGHAHLSSHTGYAGAAFVLR